MAQYDLPKKTPVQLKAPPTTSTAQAPLPVKGDPRNLTAFIQETAKKYGIDPVTALKVAKSEGLAEFYGDNGKSGGAFQLYTGGGLGNQFQKETGLDPLDPANERATIDFALKNASQGGWGPWYGAAKVGVGQFDGIGNASQNAGGPATDFYSGDPIPNTGTASTTTPASTDSTDTASSDDTTTSTDDKKKKKDKSYQDIAGDSLSDIGSLYAKGPVAQNAARASSPANLAMPQLTPQGPVPMFDAKLADAQRQQLALAMQRLNSRRLY